MSVAFSASVERTLLSAAVAFGFDLGCDFDFDS